MSEPSQADSDDAHWLVRDNIGIKIFPRCGSTTILRTYGYGQSRKRFMECENQVAVMRHPFHRLLSVCSMFINTNKDWAMGTRGYPPIHSLNELMEFAMSMPQGKLDIHLQSMVYQLGGWVPPNIYSLLAFKEDPPFGLWKIARWDHKSRPRNHIEYDLDIYKKWAEVYGADFEMWRSAKKAPCERGQ